MFETGQPASLPVLEPIFKRSLRTQASITRQMTFSAAGQGPFQLPLWEDPLRHISSGVSLPKEYCEQSMAHSRYSRDADKLHVAFASHCSLGSAVCRVTLDRYAQHGT